MNTFKKIVLLLLSVSFFFMPIGVYAKEKPSSTIKQEEPLPFIYGMDATVRDCKNLNIREEPSTSSKILASVPLDTHITVIDQIGEWFKVKYNTISGYVFWKYIYLTEEKILKNTSLIGTSIIHYTSSENRDTNIRIACETINETILNPGDEFRWSNIVGQTTPEKGYLQAPVIINKKPEMDFGGGVCQVTTALYNALLDTSMEITELHHHSIGSTYAKQDATISYGNKDFAFINSYDFPVRIEAYSYKSVVFINLYRVKMQE